MCKGTRLFEAGGHHDPSDPYKWKSCPYCDYEGTQLIEAAESTIIEYFKQLPKEDRERIMRVIERLT